MLILATIVKLDPLVFIAIFLRIIYFQLESILFFLLLHVRFIFMSKINIKNLY